MMMILISWQGYLEPKQLTWAACILLFASLSQVHNVDDDDDDGIIVPPTNAKS